ncbi:Uma2 family endonuclease [Allonocardiopsis opalescens]|uniref:Uma2 family endonuclease n=1 Tax=Allonocardiopsis opalescens TaxID=1144618 RepID=A0A2T0Q5I3_9ACTN|nr:Uma2 family endonuclease [Allonocardiopsis opalescens]PRX99056.1 Uma2 family endonuclease [Allonocardiopsis opalescens]
MTAEPLPDWFFPPPGGWTAEDLDRLPPEAPDHIELIDGALVVMSPHRTFHSRVMWRLAAALDAAAPVGVGVDIEVTVRLAKRQRPEPDVVVFTERRPEEANRTYHLPEEVLLVIEIVSAESEERDRETKPLKYAKAGIRHFWRIEEEEHDRPAVYVYELDAATERYVPTAIVRDRLKLDVPFPLDIDVAALFP